MDADHAMVEAFFKDGVGERLVARVMRLDGLTKRKSEAAFNAYKQFLELKSETEDWDATKLSPPLAVDAVWHLDILDTKTYADRCVRAFGRVVHHDIDGDLRGRNARVAATKRALRARFGAQFDETMWLWAGESQCDVLHPVKVKREAEPVPPNAPSVVPKKAKPYDGINVRIRDYQTDEETDYRIKMTTPLGRLFDAFAQRKGVRSNSLRYFLKGLRLHETQTATNVGMEDDDMLDVMPEQSGC